MAGERTSALEQSMTVAYAPKKPVAQKAGRQPKAAESPLKSLAAPSQPKVLPVEATAPVKPSAAIEALPAAPAQPDSGISHTVKRGDTIDALKKRLFPQLSEAQRGNIMVQYAGKPDKPVVPRKIQPGEKLVFTPPERPEPPALPEDVFTPPPISAKLQAKLETVAKAQKFEVTAFTDKVNAIATKYRMNPNALLAVIHCETGGTFSPSVKNPDNGATGLIQFTKTTAKSLGTTTDELAKMTAVGQLDTVEKYLDSVLKNRTGNLSDTDVYLAVFYPAKLGKGADPAATILSKATTPTAYRLNKSLDIRDGKGAAGADGVITSAEIALRLNLKQWLDEPGAVK